ncbi:MAG TPA: hydrolase [Rhodospirillaceae bacterium]|nr:MAG: hypothetical protein A2018_08205 [Alphaproteobacteria bacterium GWF2_58_20]HAU29946.1 hydrolase [Rhodospirillaceae bacterium]
MEQVDFFDENYVRQGVTTRPEALEKGLWLHSFHCWVARPCARSLLVQRRSSEKALFPGMLDITAAGHLMVGESVADGIREVHEELGVSDIAFDRLVPLGIKLDVARIGDKRTRHFAHVFLLADDRPPAAYRPQESELSGLVEISVAEGLSLFSGRTAQVPAWEWNLAGDAMKTCVSAADFIPRIDPYYYKIFILAHRLFCGERHLAI